ncbi:MAG: hypothetical protein IKZ51_03675 [Bacteroidales bacterium]|nr:hypothetical protein [Bacteroidales bacterium]
MKSIKRICAVIIGFVFIGAGLVKLMDPVGAGLVVREYCNFMHLGFLVPASNFLGVFMALLESFLGAALISGVFPVATAIASGVVIAFFTVLTFIMWRLNPAMDCGCFGEAVHLTHLQSFLKNVGLCVLWVLAFIPFSAIRKPRKIKYVSFGIAALSIILFTVWSLISIPAIDFTPFAPGATLMQADDSGDPDSPLLSICDAEGEYCDELLASGDILLMTVYDVEAAPEAMLEHAVDFCRVATEAGLLPVVVSAGELIDAAGLDAAGLDSSAGFDAAGSLSGGPQCYTSDRRTLMTVNRSNGGTTLLRDGVVVAKWPYRSMPTAERLQELQALDSTEALVKENTPKRLKLQGFLLYVFAILLLM